MSVLSDRQLLEAIRKGDETALRAFMDRYLPSVYGFALRFANDELLAEDVSQEVFLKIYRKAERYDANLPMKNWVLSITRNTIIDMIRTRKSWFRTIVEFRRHNTESESMKNQISDRVPTPEQQLSSAQESQRVMHALQVLPENQKTAIILQYFDGLSVREIADLMKISVSAVESLLIRAKRKLLEFLSDGKL